MTADSFAGLVATVLSRLAPIPVITPVEYWRITCNRCGLCCEDLRCPDSPAQIAARVHDPDEDPDQREFLAGLVPVRPVPGGWQYRCRHFARDDAGLGVCMVYERRPPICRGFPFGEVVRGWRACAWYVDVRDEHGNALRVVPPVTDAPRAGDDAVRVGDRTQER